MVKVLICDDDPYTTRMLLKIIGDNPLIDEMFVAGDGEEAVEIVRKEGPFHIILMDIDMPKLDGMEAAKLIHGLSPQSRIIFITAFGEYAAPSFAVHPYDYILKPLDIERVKEDVAKIASEMDQQHLNMIMEAANKLIVKSGSDIYFLNMEDIIFIEKQNKACIVHYENTTLKVYETLQQIEKKLNHFFYRVHRSFIVNIKKIEKIVQYNETSFSVYFEDYDKIALMAKDKYGLLKDKVM